MHPFCKKKKKKKRLVAVSPGYSNAHTEMSLRIYVLKQIYSQVK